MSKNKKLKNNNNLKVFIIISIIIIGTILSGSMLKYAIMIEKNYNCENIHNSYIINQNQDDKFILTLNESNINKNTTFILVEYLYVDSEGTLILNNINIKNNAVYDVLYDAITTELERENAENNIS
ncbi:MAG: hypothetical protein ACOCVF_02875 [bacterium]